MEISILVPVYKRYDLLKKLIDSAEAGDRVPNSYVICDNGSNFRSHIYFPEVLAKIKLLKPSCNLGVAGGWNELIRNSSDIRIICNDDIEFNKDTIRVFEEQWDEKMLCYPGWGNTDNMFSCFSVSDYLYNLVGEFDESISKQYAYFEDGDFSYRIVLEVRKGIPVGFKPLPCEYNHVGSATMKALTPIELDQHHAKFRSAQSNFIAKWGGLPNEEKFQTAYNR